MRRIGLLGGTFDPPHAAHVAMARAALAAGLVDEVLVIPAGDPWQKSTSTSAIDRLAMARIAFADEPYCLVHDLEVVRDGATYAIATVEALASPHVSLHYIVGSDTLAMLPTWHRISELVQRCSFLVVKRPGTLVDAPSIDGLRVEVVPADEMSEASTDIRDDILRTHSQPDGVADGVWQYIVEHGLYGVPHA